MGITIPRYQGPNVRDEAFPNARMNVQTSRENFGGGQSLENLGQATERALGTVEKFAYEQKLEADRMVADEYNANLTKLRNRLINDPNDGLVTKKGKDAFGAPDEFTVRFAKEADQMEDGLSNDNQRELARRIRLQHESELDGVMQRHLSNEVRNFENQTMESAIGAAQDDAVLNYQMPGKVQQAVELQRDQVLKWAKREGYAADSDVVKQKMGEITGKTHAAVIDQMITNNQDMVASDYFKGVKDQITDGETMKVIQAKLEDASIRGESQRMTDKIMQKRPSMSQAIDAAKQAAGDNAKLRDVLVDRVKGEFALAEAARRDQTEKSEIGGLNMIDANPGKLPQDLLGARWSELDTGQRNRLNAYARMKLEGRQPETSWDDFYNLKTIASLPETRDKFLRMNLMEYRTKMADPEFKQLIDIQTSLRSGNAKAASHLDGFRSDMDIVHSALSDAGIRYNAKPGTAEAKKVSLFKAKVEAEVMKLQEKTGKKATNEDIKRISDNLIIEGRTDEGLFGSGWFAGTKRLFEVGPDTKQFIIEAKDVPAEERGKIEAALRKRGIQVSDQTVLQLYRKKIGGMTRGG